MPRSKRVDSASRVIRATPDAIYRAFVDPGILIRWLPPTGMTAHIDVFDPREGGEYRITLTYANRSHPSRGKTSEHTDVAQGRFLELVLNHRIVQSVQFDSDDPAFGGEMRMTWRFEPVVEGTCVTISAENVPLGIVATDHEAGFAATLANLAAYIE